MMGKMVTAATMISAGAVKSHPSRAILLRLTSARPTRGAAAGASSAALEMVVIGHTPCPRSSRPAGLVGVQCGRPGPVGPAPGACGRLQASGRAGQGGVSLRLGGGQRRGRAAGASQRRVYVGVDRGAQLR